MKITPGASLERSDFDDGGVWVTAHSPWPGSAGDLGSPGSPFSPPPTPVLLPTVTPSPTATLAPLSTSSSTPVLTPTRTPSPTPSSTPPPLTPPRLYLSEVMANPAAVRDENGEWIELYNGDTVPINLDGWILADQGSEEASLSGELWLPPGGYIVLARMDDRVQNGGVAAHMGYSGLQLANGEDELLLLTPWGVVVDQLFWGTGIRKIANGASLERTGFDATSIWITAYAS